MECPKCHKQIQDNSKFCRYCGSKIPDKHKISLYKNPAFPYAGISILVLLSLLCIGYMLYPKPVSYVIEGTYSDDQRTLELLNDGTASFTDIDGITNTGYYTVSNDTHVIDVGMTVQSGKSVEMQVILENTEAVIFQKKSNYQALRYRLMHTKEG